MSRRDEGPSKFKILIGVLVVAAIALGLEFYYIQPGTLAMRGGVKGKPSPSITIIRTPTPGSSPTVKPSHSPSVTSSPNSLFSDDFSGTLAKWQIAWTGYGTVRIENGALMEQPKTSITAGETNSSMVRSLQGITWKDYTYELRMNTAAQLRTGSNPNPWEAGWITFRHQENSKFYYFVLKPNGIELGKALGNYQQAFFVTKESPQLQLGQWVNFRIVLKGANIKVYVNGSLVADYTDTNAPFLTGGIGLYNEDAKVYYDDVSVTSN